jgi:hypothetical protein
MLLILLGFALGVAFMLWLFSEEIFHGQQVGYGENDIHPDKGLPKYNTDFYNLPGLDSLRSRSVPPAQYKPDIRPGKQ